MEKAQRTGCLKTLKKEKLTKKVGLILVANANIFSKVFVRVCLRLREQLSQEDFVFLKKLTDLLAGHSLSSVQRGTKLEINTSGLSELIPGDRRNVYAGLFATCLGFWGCFEASVTLN